VKGFIMNITELINQAVKNSVTSGASVESEEVLTESALKELDSIFPVKEFNREDHSPEIINAVIYCCMDLISYSTDDEVNEKEAIEALSTLSMEAATDLMTDSYLVKYEIIKH